MKQISIQEIKDYVAKKHGYNIWNEFLFDNWLHDQEMNEVIDEVILEVSKQTAEKQREICAKQYINTQPTGTLKWVKQSILNASTPVIK